MSSIIAFIRGEPADETVERERRRWDFAIVYCALLIVAAASIASLGLWQFGSEWVRVETRTVEVDRPFETTAELIARLGPPAESRPGSQLGVPFATCDSWQKPDGLTVVCHD